MSLLFVYFLGCSSTQVQSEISVEKDSGVIDTAVLDSEIDTAILDSGSIGEDTGLDTDEPIESSLRYDQAYFATTHNSYSGETRGTITEQLDAGIRGFEFDIHDDNFYTLGDYQLGHFSPGGEVELGHGNPTTALLSDWLMHMKDWSDAHSGHAPITITIDLKDNLTDNVDFNHGSMAHLNRIFVQTLGEQLFTPKDLVGEWPTIEELQDRFVLVLSGHEDSRKRYKSDRGHSPAISINDNGQVIEVHDSGSGALWYWTGQIQSGGSIEWKHHGRYDSGQSPAIDLNNDGWFVEVHQSHTNPTLWTRVGYLDQDYVPIFGDSSQFDNGVRPTIRFYSKDDIQLREIHQSQNTGLYWDWEVSLDSDSASLSWGAHTQTNDIPHDKHRDTALEWVEVSTDSDQSAGDDTLIYETSLQRARIRYQQIAFVEFQHHNASELMDFETWFAASDNQSILETWNSSGLITRQWGFTESNTTNLYSPPNFPATDFLWEEWYTDYCTLIGTVE